MWERIFSHIFVSTKTNRNMTTFEINARKLKTNDLIKLQEGMMMLKTNKTQMSQIDILEDIICERLETK